MGLIDIFKSKNKMKEIAPNIKKAEKLFKKGLSYQVQEQYSIAISYYTKALNVYPEYAQAYNSRGACYVLEKKYEKALSDCTNAINIDSNFDEAYKIRSIVYSMKKQYDDVIEDMNKAITLNPQPHYYVRLGDAYNEKGQLMEAIANYRKVTELNPNMARIH